jgi:hypothetical protein
MADDLVFEFRTPTDKLRGDLTQARGLMRSFLSEAERDETAMRRRLSASQVRELQRANRDALREHARFARSAADEYERHLGQGFFARLGRAATAGFRSGFKVGGETFGGGSGLGGVAGGALSVATGNLLTGIITGAVDQIKQGIAVGMDFNRLKESTLLGLRRKLGSEREAERFFNEVAAFAQDDSPLKIAQAVAQANRLLALNFKPEEIITVLRAAGDAAAGMGLVGEEAQAKVEQITKALSDIRGKQRVNAEELSRQLQEAGVSGWRYISEELRKNPEYARLNEAEAIAVARDLAEKNRLSADAVVGIIVKGMAREFGGMGRAINLETLAGQESMTEDLLSVVMGTGTQGLFKHKLTGQRALNQMLQSDAAGRIAGSISGATDTALTGVEDAIRALGFSLPKLGAEGAGSYAEGFKGGAGAAYEAGSAVGGAAEKGIRDKLDQHSPSLVMLALGREAGQSFVTGLMQGVGGQRFTDEIERLIEEAAARWGLDPNLIRAVMQRESGGRRGAISPKGARGLMQLMPGTARRFGARDIFDPAQNIDAGAHYLKWLLNRYGGDVELALAGYNAGEGAVDKYGGIPPYRETQAYVPSVLARYRQLSGGSVGVSDAVPVRVVGAPNFSGFPGTPYSPEMEARARGSNTPATNDLTGGVGRFAGPGNQRAFLEWLYALERGTTPGGRTSVSAQSDYNQRVALMAKELDVTSNFVRLAQEHVTRILEQERRLSGASGGSFRPDSAFANITEEQARRVLEMNRGSGLIQQEAATLATTITPQALSVVRLAAQETKGAFENLPPLIKKSTEEAEAFAKTFSGMLVGTLRTGVREGWGHSLEGLLTDFRDWTLDLFEEWVRSKIFKALSGETAGGASGGGLSFGGLWDGLKGLFGGGGGGSGGGVTVGGFSGGLFNIGGAARGARSGGLLGALSGLFGLGGGATASTAASAAASPAAISAILGGVAPGAGIASVFGAGTAAAVSGGGAAAGAGAAAGGGGLLGSMGALFTNPWTAVIGGGILAGFGIAKLFGRNKTEKALREAIQREYGVRIKENDVLEQIKHMGEARFGRGQVRANLAATIRLPDVMELISEYAADTGQTARGALAPAAPKLVGIVEGRRGTPYPRMGIFSDGTRKLINPDGTPYGYYERPGGPLVQELSRNQPAPAQVIVHQELVRVIVETHTKNEPGTLTETIIKTIQQPGNGAADAVAAAFRRDWRRLGETRQTVLEGVY